MLIDARTRFASAVSCANEAGGTLIGDVIDLGAAARDIGQGQPLYLVIQVTTAFDGGGTAGGITTFRLVSDAQAAIAVDGSETIHVQTDNFAAATQLTAGTVIVMPIPMQDNAGGKVYERYLGLQQFQASEGEDDGAITAFLTTEPHGWQAYADAAN